MNVGRRSRLRRCVPLEPRDVAGMAGSIDLLFNARLEHVSAYQISIDADPRRRVPATLQSLRFRWLADRGNIPGAGDDSPGPTLQTCACPIAVKKRTIVLSTALVPKEVGAAALWHEVWYNSVFR